MLKKNQSLRLPLAGVMAAAALLVASACGVPEAERNEGGVQKSARVQAPADVQKTADMGLGADHALRARNTLVDELGTAHVRYDHLYRGVRVWGGDTIVHSNAAGSTTTGRAMADIHISTHAALSAQDALAVAHRDLQPRGPYARQPAAELVIYPQEREVVSAKPMRGPGGELNAIDIEHVIDGYTLAYYVHTELENGAEDTRYTDYLIDASSGTILEKWDALETAAAIGTGYSQYSGTVPLGTNSITGGFEMRDVARGMSFATYDMGNGTSGTGTIFTDPDNIWGDGANYIPGGSVANRQTAGVDAHYGVAKTYDYYYYVHGRNGIDGAGTPTYSRVHYSSSYDNAFWSDSCFCMTYGDGSYFKVLTSLDVAGHEMSHGVTSRTAGLIYSGESGGLNESMSDIGGTMVEFHARGGSGSTIGNSGGTWTIGEQLNGTPLRYMYKPSKDGTSPDAWYSGIGSIDVHYSSGPMNRAFYFLSQGASSTAGSDYYSSYLPGGMTGIGNDHAARIQFRALVGYMTSNTNYAAARTAFLNAASVLYGSTSADYAAVENAFAAINVGAPHSGGTATQIYNGIPVGPLSGAAGSQLYYKISVPAGQAALRVDLSAMTGDADLYVKYGALPTTSTYDCRPYYGSGLAETCTFANPAAGDWYIMVRGWSTYSNAYLTASYWANLRNGLSMGPLSGAAGGQVYYKITVPAGQAGLSIGISAMTGDADLYVKYGALPTTSTYDCRPFYGSGLAETCTFTNPAAGDWYVMVRGWSAYSNLYLTGTYWANLADGIPVGPLSTVSYDDQLDYKITVPAGRTSLTVLISGGSGDADLYVKYGGLATLSTFDCRPYIGGNYEVCTFTNPAAGDWYIMVNAWSPFSGVMLTADYVP